MTKKNMKYFWTLILSILFSLSAQAETPCDPKAGQALPWQGTGAGTGNILLSIPFPTLGTELYYNTEASTGNFGYGTAAWRLSVDVRLRNPDGTYDINQNNANILSESGDGTQSSFQGNSQNGWKSSNAVITRSQLYFENGQFVEETRGHTKTHFRPIVFGGVSLRWFSNTMRGNNPYETIGITRGNTGLVTELVLPFNKKIRFGIVNDRTESITDVAGNTYTLRYDEINRLIAVVYPDGSGWTINYHGSSNLVAKISNTSDESTELTYNTQSGVIGSLKTQKGYVTNYTYTNDQVEVANQVDKLTERFNENHALIQSTRNGLVTDYVVNSSNLPTLVTSPIGSTLVFDYDERLNLKSLQDENGVLTTYTYSTDGKDNIVQIKNGPLTTLYTYENDRIKTITTPEGRLLVLTRDNFGNIKEIKEGETVLMNATYDTSGMLTRVTNKGGMTQSYSYLSGLLNQFVDPLGRTTSYPSYSALGLPTQVTLPGGLTQTTSYDSMGRVTDSTVSNGNGKSIGTTTTRTTATVAAKAKKSKVKYAEMGGSVGSTVESTKVEVKIDGNTKITHTEDENGETKTNNTTVKNCKGCSNVQEAEAPSEICYEGCFMTLSPSGEIDPGTGDIALISACCKFSDEAGLSRIWMSLENLGNHSDCANPEEIRQVCADHVAGVQGQ